jgi:hypothetical protein
MKDYCLQSQQDSIGQLSSLFGVQTENAKRNLAARLEVCEAVSFGANNWLDIGEIRLYPSDPESVDSHKYVPTERALKLGAYEWELPPFDTLQTKATGLLGDKPKKLSAKEKPPAEPETTIALQAITDVAIRCGLAHPLFDANSVMEMPFKRATTVVADSVSVLHGGLDFVVRFLYPLARVKIPAVVHTEILQQVDRYLKQHETNKPNKGTALLDHVNSQGSQRALLRLALQTDAEIEHPSGGTDSLRSMLQPDPEVQGQSGFPRGLVDLLILEAVRQYKERLSPTHPVMLLTSNQRLAQMALSEGLQPLFFDKNYSRELFARTLSGTCFRPFIDPLTRERLYSVPLTELVWELAVTFGNARLRHPTTDAIFEVSATGEARTWNPYQAKDDLLWVRGTDQKRKVEPKTAKAAPEAKVTPPAPVKLPASKKAKTKASKTRVAEAKALPMTPLLFEETTATPSTPATDLPAEPTAKKGRVGKTKKAPATSSKAKAETKAKVAVATAKPAKTGQPKVRTAKQKTKVKATPTALVEELKLLPQPVVDQPLPHEEVAEFKASLTGSYKFSVPSMLLLLDTFSKRVNLTDDEGMKVVGVETSKRYNEYRNFLFTGSFLDRGTQSFIKTDKLDKLWEAFKQLDYRAITDYLSQVPSLADFLKGLRMETPSTTHDLPTISKSAFPTYCILAEMIGVGLNIAGEGIYLTNQSPSVEEFAKAALESYKLTLGKGDKAALTGLWLETLAKKYGIHPLTAKTLLPEAQQAGALKYQTEGADVKNPKRDIMYYLAIQNGMPVCQQINLYGGEFLTPDHTSVNIQITKGK